MCTSVAVTGSLSSGPSSLNGGRLLQDFHRHHERLTQKDQTHEVEDWQAELCHYLKVIVRDVSPEGDIIEWWQVHFHLSQLSFVCSHILDPC